MAVVGYSYANGPHGARMELYRVPVEETAYKRVIASIKRTGGTPEQMDQRLFNHYKPS